MGNRMGCLLEDDFEELMRPQQASPNARTIGSQALGENFGPAKRRSSANWPEENSGLAEHSR